MSGGSRRAFSILALVVFFALVSSVVVFAAHFLWRGSSRTLFSVQEQRQLVNLGRSALEEAYVEFQHHLDEGQADWFDWFTAPDAVPERTFAPATTREDLEQLAPAGGMLRFVTSDVTIRRVRTLDTHNLGGDSLGVLDLIVTVEVHRTDPAHHAQLTLVTRRTFRLAESVGPYGSAGRHVEVTPTPAGTWIEGD